MIRLVSAHDRLEVPSYGVSTVARAVPELALEDGDHICHATDADVARARAALAAMQKVDST